jgi:hypothetical protein
MNASAQRLFFSRWRHLGQQFVDLTKLDSAVSARDSLESDKPASER